MQLISLQIPTYIINVASGPTGSFFFYLNGWLLVGQKPSMLDIWRNYIWIEKKLKYTVLFLAFYICNEKSLEYNVFILGDYICSGKTFKYTVIVRLKLHLEWEKFQIYRKGIENYTSVTRKL